MYAKNNNNNKQQKTKKPKQNQKIQALISKVASE